MAEDINIMTVPKYVPKAPNQREGTGYNSDTRQSIEPSFIDVQTTVDLDSDAFKYGYGYKSGPSMETMQTDPLFFFQDPLFPTYDVILDTTRSPLFIVNSGDTYNNSLAKFLSDYSDIYSMRSRIKIHEQFLKTLYNLFNTEFNQIERNKSYYINSISGLDNLTARIVDFEKQKITINLNEDISMVATYLAQLYNNLSYSYKDQKLMIPYNLLRFNMYIKVHDVRNMPFYIPNADSGTTTSFDKSYVIYVLRDCSFDFKKSKNFEDSITAGGFDAGAPTKTSSISFDVVYKSIEIESEFPLIMDLWDVGSSALKLNNKDSSLTFGQSEDNKPTALEYNIVFMNNYKTPQSFADELTQSSTFNNDQDSSIARNRTLLNSTSGSTAEAQRNYKFGVVSSDTNSSTREGDIKEVDRKYEPTSNITFEDMNNHRVDSLNDWRLYDPAVFDGEWNTGFGQSGPEVQALKTSFMNEVALYEFLFSLPQNILTKFFGGMHGLNPLIPIYVPDEPSNIPPMEEIYVYSGETNDLHKSPAGDTVDTETKTKRQPLDAFMQFDLKPSKHISGSIDTHFDPRKYLDGEFIPFALRPRQPIDAFIPFALRPRQPLDAFIPFALRPPQKLSGKLEFVIKPKDQLDARIDTTPRPYKPVLGVIDTTIKPKEPLDIVLDMTPRERELELGRLYENTYGQREIDLGLLYSAVKKEHLLPLLYLYSKTDKFNNLTDYKVYNNAESEIKPLDARIDQQTRQINPLQIIYKYDNNIDMEKTLGNLLLYNNEITKLKNLEIIDLYGKVEAKNELTEKYLYENERAEVKSLDDQHIQMQRKKQSQTDLGSIDTSVEYILKPKLGYIYTLEDTEKKLLEPVKLYQPPKKSSIELDLGEIYEKFKYRGNIFDQKIKPEEIKDEERTNVLEHDRIEVAPFKRNKNILNPTEEERKKEASKDLEERKRKDEEYKGLHGDKLEHGKIIEQSFERRNITEEDKGDEREKSFLDGQKLDTREDMSTREKNGLDHERLR